MDLILKPSCGCGSTSDLYGSSCKHMTLCLSCGKKMAESRSKCRDCGLPISKLIREYNVRASSNADKSFYIGRFPTGLPVFSRKKNNEVRWSLQKEGAQGRQLTEALREKLKNKPWLLEDETGQYQYQGQLEGAQYATYYLLMMQGKEFVAIPAGSWFNFNKVAQYKQLTLEEAEEKMKNRRRTADGYERWMMKAANNGAAAFGETEKFQGQGSSRGGGSGSGEVEGGRRKKSNDDEEDNAAGSDKGEEDEEEEEERKNRLGMNKKSGGGDEEGLRGGDLDMDDDDIEKGDDWEHEEIFTDDDEAVGNDPEEREDLDPELPAPPEIKQDDEDEQEGDEDEEGLSKSGKELKKLLGRAGGLNESDAEDDDDDDDVEDDVGTSPVLAPKQKDALKEEQDVTPVKPTPSGSQRGTPSSAKSSKAKRKPSDDIKPSATGTAKKPKTETDSKQNEAPVASRPNASLKTQPTQSAGKNGNAAAIGPVSEEEIRTVLLQNAPLTTQDLVAKFKARLKTPEDKASFASILKKISRIQKTNGANFVVLREK